MPTVSIQGQTEVYQVNEGEVILDALEKRGKELPHGCLAGSCGACKVEIVSGEGNLNNPSEMESNTINSIENYLKQQNGNESMDGKTIRLSCRAKVMGDIKIKPI